MVDPHDSFPSSINVPMTVAVTALVFDPRCIWSVTRIGSGDPILRTPNGPDREPVACEGRTDQTRHAVGVPDRCQQPGESFIGMDRRLIVSGAFSGVSLGCDWANAGPKHPASP